MKPIDWTLIDKSLSGTLDEEESAALTAWLAESDEHRRLYRKIKAYDSYTLSQEKYEKWVSEYLTMLPRLKQQKRKKLIRRLLLISGSVAAVFALVASLALLLNAPVSENSGNVGGAPKVQLQLANGDWLDLGTDQENHSAEIGNARISPADKTLTYRRTDRPSEVEYNVLKTERGGEWNLMLEDGTKVYLNSSSTLKYPTTFAGEKRQVILEGEAFFEVSHNPEKPFVVKTNEMDIIVLGTSFNINAYPDQKTTRTTLVNGKIQVECSGSTHIVLPGQQIVFEKETKTTEILEVDTELYTSWKNGFYKFHETRLEDILTTLSLWYDVEVIYTDESVKELCFTSSDKMIRYDSLMSLLKKFEYIHDVRFELKGKQLTVSKK